jgi:hypothetical protein
LGLVLGGRVQLFTHAQASFNAHSLGILSPLLLDAGRGSQPVR